MIKTIFVIIQFTGALMGPSAYQLSENGMTSGKNYFDTRQECEQKLLEITAQLGGEIIPDIYDAGFYRVINFSDGRLNFAERCVEIKYDY